MSGSGLPTLVFAVVAIRIISVAMAMVAYVLTVMAVWMWRVRRGKRLAGKGFPPAPPSLLVLPKAGGPPLTRHEILAVYARRPAQFERALSVKLLVDGREAYPEMLTAIESATATVVLETYILRADRTGTRFQEALCRAARRGVHVRLLYDYVGSLGLPDGFVRHLMDAGVEVAVYHPLVLDRPIWFMNRRDHRKILVVDRKVMFIGGLNIADDYAAAEDGGGGWRDTHVRLDGIEVAEEGERLFEMGWRKADVSGEMPTRAARLRAGLRARLRKLVNIRDAWRREPHAVSTLQDEKAVPVDVVGNDEFRYRWRISRAYLHAIRHARRYILIENAYFIPVRAVRQALARAVRRGVLVAVAVPGHSDVPIAAHASRSLYGELLKSGVRIFEWPHGMLHAKTAVVDDAWAIVGSYNFDHRSLLHQLEAVAIVADHDFASRLREQSLADLAQCHEVTLGQHESRPRWQVLVDYGAYMLRHWL